MNVLRTVMIAILLSTVVACEQSNGINVKDFGATTSDGIDDTAGIQAALNSVKSSQSQIATVFFPAGRYLIDSSLTIPSNVRLLGDNASLLPKKGSESAKIRIKSGSNIEFDSLSFDKVWLEISANVPQQRDSVRDISIVRSTFKNTYLSEPDGVTQSYTRLIGIGYVNGVTISDCDFIRDNERYAARGVAINSAHNVSVRNSRFDGYFKTAINVFGAKQIPANSRTYPTSHRSYNIHIEGNTISRAQGAYAEDHGIYAWGFDTLHIRKNTISGWSLTSYGMSIKARNGDNLFVLDNHLINSGVTMFVYDSSADMPIHLRGVRVEGNVVDLEHVFYNGHKPVVDQAGIAYQRTVKDPEPHSPIELDWKIANNKVIEGEIRLYDQTLGELSHSDNSPQLEIGYK